MIEYQQERQGRNAASGVQDASDLPPPSTKRWVASRKAVVVKAVLYGLIPQAEALERAACAVLGLPDPYKDEF